jgi:hypothetical protein
MAKAVSIGKPKSVDDIIKLPPQSVLEKEAKLELRTLESTHRVIMLYLWLRYGLKAYRFILVE